jgi:RND family efflux transporter MFP subunit
MNKIQSILLLAGIALLGACAGKENSSTEKVTAVPVTVASPSHQSSDHVIASGQIASKETAIISTRVMGFVTGFKVKVGDAVKKGQLLATISNADILAKRAQAQAMLTEAEAALKDAKKDYERFEELYKQKSASTKEFENATLHYNSIKAKAEAAQQMKNEADAMLTYTNLTAPFSGVVTQRNVDEGSMANPGMPILMVEQSGLYEVRASVSEADIARVKSGSTADLEIPSIGKKLAGKITEVSSSSQYSGGQYLIRISIPTDPSLLSGMYVHVSIPVAEKKETGNRLLVPATALVNKDQLTGIYTISQSQTALLHWVKTGRQLDGQVEILSGLSADEKFILQSEGKLYNGVPVTVK